MTKANRFLIVSNFLLGFNTLMTRFYVFSGLPAER
jgi:hypothetical protein